LKKAQFTAPAISLFGIRIHAIRMAQALDIICAAIAERAHLQIGVVNAAKVVNMGKDPSLGEDVRASDLILADGIAVVWASRLLGAALPERVTGIDLMYGMLERGNQKGFAVYCLGATEEISAKVAQKISEQFPNVRIAGRQHGYFKPDEEAAVAAAIGASRADILLVAMTSPKKENFMARWNETMGVPVCHGVGGSFDVMAGKVERAPVLWQKLGMEWLYRVKQEPRRLWKRYLVTNTQFTGMVLSGMVRRLFGAGT
jgi:N-acetylglucosaminyldiphosphoundecaprenol N-acetyl-beta-D-mannosaminyltransferase